LNPALAKVREDLEEYQLLCVKYGEAPQYKHGQLDCYGEHANALRSRLAQEERTAKQKAEADEMVANMATMMPDWEVYREHEAEAEKRRAEEAAKQHRAFKKAETARKRAAGLLPPTSRFKRKPVI